MARRRKRKNPSSVGEVIGGVLGFLLPPLGLGALVTGVARPSFWRGAAVGGVVGFGVGLVAYFGRTPSLAAAPSRASLGDGVKVGTAFEARGAVFRAIRTTPDEITGVNALGGGQVVLGRDEVTRILELQL